jgi:selenocysteine-specific elongation factor
MVAGVAGIHHVLIVVAADDGPMPQTAEHLAIIDLVGVRSASVVITKVDRAEPARVAEVTSQVLGMLNGTALQDSPAFTVSSVTGDGIDALAEHLAEKARAWTAPPPRGHFRLAVDRSFTLAGVGVVVTGTSFAGTVKIDDAVGIVPRGIKARVRGLHAQNRKAQLAGAGERCALNLSGTGVEADAIARGDWVVAEGLLAPTRRIDARLRVLPGSPPLRAGTRVHVHIGAKQTTGRVFPLSAEFAQLALDEDVGALWGDRLILRDWSAQRTLGGGRVLDPFASARGRSHPERLAVLEAHDDEDAAASLARLAAREAEGVRLDRFALSRNLTAEERERLLAEVDVVSVMVEREVRAFDPAQWAALRDRVLHGLDHWHKRNPNAVGLSADQLRRNAGIKLPLAIVEALVAELVQRGEMVRRGNLLHQPGHRTVMSPEQHSMWQRLRRLMAEGGTRPPPVGELAIALKLEPPQVEAFLKEMAKLQLVVQVAENRFYLRDALAQLARTASDLAAEREKGLFAAAEFRDRSGIGRNLSIQVLQFFDRVGFTRRIGENQRKVIRKAEEVFGA